jgi:glutaredoxin
MTPKIKIIGLEKCGPCKTAAMLAEKHLQPEQYEIIKYDDRMLDLRTFMRRISQPTVPIIIFGDKVFSSGQVDDFIRNFNEDKKE